MACALWYDNGTTPLQPSYEYDLFAYAGYSDPCCCGWTLLMVMWPHPLLSGAVQALSKCILDVNAPWYVPWGMATAPHHFNHPLNITFLHSQPTVTLAGVDGQY